MSPLGLRLHADEEHWIPLSDMMTGLMFLFLLIALAYMVAVQNQQAKPQGILQRYQRARADLKDALQAQFGKDLARWGATFDPKTLSIRFTARDVLFARGSAELQPRFKAILDDFFPRYVRLLNRPEYRPLISEVRIEGYTSSFWRPGASLDESYIGNMALSQDRTRSVLGYALALPAVAPEKPWLMQVLTANGLSFSHLIRHPDGTEDAEASQRVEFRVRTDAEAQVAKILALAATRAPAVQPATMNAALAAVPVVGDPRPPFPAWAATLVGKPLQTAFPRRSSGCLGFFDGIKVRYAGTPAGEEVFGWAIDAGTKAPVRRVVLADSGGIVVGAAEGGLPRPDVPSTMPQVTSQLTGWQGYVRETSPPISAWAVLGHPAAICRLPASQEAGGEGM